MKKERVCSILVVDDEPSQVRAIERVLMDLEVQIRSAGSASEALAKMSGPRPDVMILDVLMRAPAGQRPDSVSADGMETMVWVGKPVKPSELMNALVNVLSLHSEEVWSEQGAPDKPAQNRKGFRILLAEDNPVNRKLAILMLKKEGHTTTVVENGEEAVRRLQTEDFDLVLMDVQMPVMDGVEATRWVRAMEKESGRHVPIVALTANAMVGDRERYMAAGMDDYVSKPFKADMLRQVIERNTEKGGRQSGL